MARRPLLGVAASALRRQLVPAVARGHEATAGRRLGLLRSASARSLSVVASSASSSSSSWRPPSPAAGLPPRGGGRRRGLSSEAQPKALDDIIITNACVKRVKALRQRQGNPALKLRLAVEGGGCSGFQYNFSMDDGPVNEDDRVFEKDGAQLVVDEGALEFVRGATVDFTEDMMRSAFAVVNNPQSESACGCGSSFALKNFQKNPAID